MDKVKLNTWLSIGSNVGVLAGLIFLAIEIQQNSEQLELDLVFQANQKMFENNRELVNGNLNVVYARALTSPADLTFEEYLQASTYTLNLLNEWEDRFFIYEAGLITDEQWKSHVAENIHWTLGSDFAKTVWNLNTSTFESNFVEYINELMPTVRGNVAFEEWVNFQQQLER